MSTLRLLLVEDSEQELEILRDISEEYIHEKKRKIDIVECKTLEEALNTLDNSFDGAIIDLKLADQGDEGNKIVKKIVESFFRIPIAILTAIPGNWDESLNEEIMLMDVFVKGEVEYVEILDRFWEIYNTGLTRIMGGRGKIEIALNKVFLKNLKPQIKTWISYGEENSERTERSLLRYTLNHLFQLLEEDGESCFVEEFYLSPPATDKITTGSIVKEKTTDQPFLVLSPACDLVIRKNGKSNTNFILLASIESMDDVLNGKKSKGSVKELCTNRRAYYHWLPETKFFDGGIINFRKLITFQKDVFDENFGKPTIQISPFFIKDIVSRFSSYYARQGQPEIDSEDFITRYTS